MRSIIELLRVRHYIKNLFTLAGILFVPFSTFLAVKWDILAVFLSFCLASSAVYIFNDLRDCDEDRLHPFKKHRPIAAGAIKKSTARLVLIALLPASFILASFTGVTYIIILSIYIAINLAYSLRLKYLVIIDALVISCGYVLRVLAGTLGVGIPPSNWLILCTMTLSLFLAFGKRRNELVLLAEEAGEHRLVLHKYSVNFLDQMIMVTASASIVFYSLYTIAPETVAQHHTDKLFLTVPFVLYGLFRYMFLLFMKKGGGDPALEILADRALIINIILWLISVLFITRFC